MVVMAGENKSAPAFSGRDIKGKIVNSSTLYKGKATMVFFWHSCCGIDKKQLSLLKEYYTTYKDDGLQIVGIATDGVKKTPQVKKAVQKYGMNWTSMIDKNKAIKGKFNPIMLPTLYLIDENGRILDYYSGFKAEYEQQQREYLKSLFSN